MSNYSAFDIDLNDMDQTKSYSIQKEELQKFVLDNDQINDQKNDMSKKYKDELASIYLKIDKINSHINQSDDQLNINDESNHTLNIGELSRSDKNIEKKSLKERIAQFIYSNQKCKIHQMNPAEFFIQQQQEENVVDLIQQSQDKILELENKLQLAQNDYMEDKAQNEIRFLDQFHEFKMAEQKKIKNLIKKQDIIEIAEFFENEINLLNDEKSNFSIQIQKTLNNMVKNLQAIDELYNRQYQKSQTSQNSYY